MEPSRFLFWQKWLTLANVFALLVGLWVAFAGNTFPLSIHNAFTEEVFLDGESFSPQVLALKNWLFGIIGGTIVGFHLLMIFISEHAFKKKEKWAYQAMWLGLLSWFCIDSGISIFSHAGYNVWLINAPALIMIGTPLLATYKAFFRPVSS